MSPNTSAPTFPVIGLGASAGGLEALTAFFKRVAEDSGMAFVVVVHLTRTQPSLLPELLQKASAIPVATAIDGEKLRPNRVYVIPPNKELSLFRGAIQLMEVVTDGLHLPIDTFFKSLALDRDKSAAVILSGTGTDGTAGAAEIKATGGLVLAQSSETAGYDGMPRSAVSAGTTDMVLAPDEMPDKLAAFYSHTQNDAKGTLTGAADDPTAWLNKIFAVLRSRLGHDFSVYKSSTILRRINRRMGLNQIDKPGLYLRYLRETPGEIESLFQELLIGVTSFFRDPDSYAVLKDTIVPAILESLDDDDTLRVWIPGCSSGEEVYSLAMVIREVLDAGTRRINLQLFGTDIDGRAVDTARMGLYPAGIAADVGPERLKRFFIKEGDCYRIRKEIRDAAIFSVQDIIKDPPFSRLHLLCCRNLLIYLDTPAQRRLLPLFHYTLAPDGILMLGSSETIGGFSNLFATVDKRWKIFRRKEVPQAMRQIVDFPSGPATTDAINGMAPTDLPLPKTDIGRITRQLILDEFAPTAILIDARGAILHVEGRTGLYLETPSGPPTQNILDMAREGLRIELSSAIRAARASGQPAARHGIIVKTNGDHTAVTVQVCPLQAPKELAGRLLLVLEAEPIIDADPGGDDTTPNAPHPSPDRITELERELQHTRESHQTTIEELESSNEELKSTNEEMQSSNEELQSTNEELESSKEELQSLNEELQTVNAELQSKVEELSAAHDDMRNLLNSTEVATIFVDNQLRVKRFTAEATAIVNLIQTDIGRPLQHVVTNLDYAEMIDDLNEVLTKLIPKQQEVKTESGHWYNMRIVPYRTIDNRIDGAVLTFATIQDQKKAQDTIRETRDEMTIAWQLTRNLFDMSNRPLVVVDRKGAIAIASKTFTTWLGIDPETIAGQPLMALQDHFLASDELEHALATALATGQSFTTDVTLLDASNHKQTMRIRGDVVVQHKEKPYRLLLEFTEHR